MDELSSATVLAAAVRSRQVSPREALDACLERVDRLNPELNAVVWRNDEQARADALRLEKTLSAGSTGQLPLAGVPVPIKDLTPVAGWPITYGSLAAPEEPSVESELVVEAFRRAGCILAGRTNTPEFGPLPVTENLRYGITRNPWDLGRSPGGSSGGAAAAVASGMFPIAHGNDGGGSIRIPASCCGLVGLKPSRGRVPAIAPEWQGAVVEGALCKTVADAACVLDAISGPDPLCWYNAPVPPRPFAEEVGADPGRLRVGMLSTAPLGLPLEDEPRHALERAAQVMEQLGHHVGEAEVELAPPELVPTMINVVNSGYGEFEGIDWAEVEAHNAAGYRTGEATGSVTFARSLIQLQKYSRRVVAHWGRDFDVLLTPTMSVEPPLAGAVLEEAEASPEAPPLAVIAMICFTAPFNMVGLPAISLPLHWAPSGLPVGVQLVTGPWQEGLLVRVASQLEEAAGWSDRRPPLVQA